MNEIDYKTLDLNLLITFDVLMRERSVTRAAKALHRSQSAVSHALDRLRGQLGDPLLVKTSGVMQPTPYALEIEVGLRKLLKNLAALLNVQNDFAPLVSTRTFTLAMPDFSSGFFPALQARVMKLAPKVKLEWTAIAHRSMQDMVQGLLDLTLQPAAVHRPEGIAAQPVAALAWACATRVGHPALSHWDEATWRRAAHVMVRVGDELHRPLEKAIKSNHMPARNVQTVVPNFSAIGPLLEKTDLVATLPHLVLADLANRHSLAIGPVPFFLPPVEFVLCWPDQQGVDAGLVWLRGLFLQEFMAVLPKANSA